MTLETEPLMRDNLNLLEEVQEIVMDDESPRDPLYWKVRQQIRQKTRLDLKKEGWGPNQIEDFIWQLDLEEDTTYYQTFGGTGIYQDLHLVLGWAQMMLPREGRTEEFETAPGWFAPPIAFLKIWSGDPDHPGTWQGKRLPKEFHDPFGTHWYLENIYFFDSMGEAVKFERTTQDLWFPKDRGSIPKVDFVPDQESNYTELTPEDYEQILFYIRRLKTGEFIIPQVQKLA